MGELVKHDILTALGLRRVEPDVIPSQDDDAARPGLAEPRLLALDDDATVILTRRRQVRAWID